MAFAAKSNDTFNNIMFSAARITAMHEQMKRLYKAAKELKGITGQSALARALNTSPQRIKNWESRGVSTRAMLDAERVIGCSAVWIETGKGECATALANVEPGPDLIGRVPRRSFLPCRGGL